MRYYFVRHGESQANADQRFQDKAVPLSAIGAKQARLIARRFESIPIDVILSSTYARAIQTAEIINERINAPMQFTALLEELHNPKEIEGLPYTDPLALKIKAKIEKHRHDPVWHYSNEENIADLLARAQLFCALLLDRKEEHVLIVTHGATLKMILTVMIFGDDANEQLFRKFNRSFGMTNTGITWCESTHDSRWLVHAWNDSEHLGQPRHHDTWIERN